MKQILYKDKKEALEILKAWGVVDVTEQFNELTFHYRDGSSWLITMMEIRLSGKPVTKLIPTRGLH